MIFFFNDTATTEIYTLSLHDALPILTWVEQSVGHAALKTVGTGDEELFGAYMYSRAQSVMGGTSQIQKNIIAQDRKSTRLNSSHANISYAVFCLKKTTLPWASPLCTL